MRRATAAAISLLALAGPAHADPARNRPEIANPDWIRRPTAEDLARYYPELASRLELEGRATIVCGVDELGELKDCAVAEEAPKDIGFGAAGLRMARLFQMRPVTQDGVAVAGGTVSIPLAFRLPRGPAAAPRRSSAVAPALHPFALEPGRRLADLSKAIQVVTSQYDQGAAKVEGGPSKGRPDLTSAAIADGYRSSVRAHANEIREAFARAYAQTFSADELTRIVAFEASTAGASLRSHLNDPDLAKVLARNLLWRVRTGAHDQFCKAWACDLPVGITTAPADAAMDDPEWSLEPTNSQLSVAEPRLARLLRVAGFVRLRCRAADEGKLDACEVRAEAPVGLGYGPAALPLTEAYRLKSASAARGQTVTVRMFFAPPDLLPPQAIPPSASRGALVLARQAAAGDGRTPDFEKEMARTFQHVLDSSSAELSPDAAGALQSAFAVAVPKATAAYVQERASLIAASLSDEEIAQATAFVESPAGRAWWERAKALDERLDAEMSPVRARITKDVHAAFCRVHTCLN